MWHRRAGVALRTMARKTGLTSLGESLITRMISALAVCWSSASARAFSSRLSSPASRLRDSVSRLSDFSRASTLASSAAFVTCVMDTLLRQGAGPGAVSSRQLPHLRLRLLQPVRHAHLAVHRRRGGEVLLRLLASAGAPVELAEAEVAVCDERAHAELTGERQRLAVVAVSVLWGNAAGGDLSEEAEGPRLVAALTTLAGKGQRLPGEFESVLEPVGEDVRFAQIHQEARL